MKRKWLFEACIVFFWASEYCHAPYFTPYLSSLEISATVVGMIVACYGLTQMLIRIPLGMATDTTGAYRSVIIAGLFFTTVSSLGLYLTTNVPLIFVCRILAGMASSTWIATTVAYMACYPTSQSVVASARLNAFNNGGKLLAFVLGGVAAVLWGYRVTLFMSFAVGLVGSLLVPFVHPVAIKKHPATLKRLGQLIVTPAILIPALLMAMQQVVLQGTVFSFTSSIGEQVGASPAMLSVLSAVFTVVQIASARLIAHPSLQQAPRGLVIGGGFVLLSLYLVLLGLATNVWIILVGQVMCAFGAALLASLLLAECVRGIDPGERSTVVGIFQAVYGIGMTLGPVCMGWLLDRSPVLVSCGVMAIAVLGAALASVLFWRKRVG